MRWQLPVHSPVGVDTLAAGASAALGRDAAGRAAGRLASLLGGRATVLTDSGTSALVLALQALVPAGGTVALPGWGCIDISAAAAFTGARVRLYDVSPETMSPDLASLERALARGVDAVVVAHFYGYPADVGAVRALAARFGARVIEDAAQRAGATLHGLPLGTHGDVTVLSFGRGKGTTGGAGGALVVNASALVQRAAEARASLARSRGLRPLAATAVQWLLGRPAVYGLPASLPGLRLGEMVYHPAHAPAAMSDAATAMVVRSLARDPREVRVRRTRAARLRAVLEDQPGLTGVDPLPGAKPGYLRFVVRASGARRPPAPRLGILPGYPMTLDEHPPLRPLLLPGEEAGPGARALRDSVLTLPTHSLVTEADLARLVRWLQARTSDVAAAAERVPAPARGF